MLRVPLRVALLTASVGGCGDHVSDDDVSLTDGAHDGVANDAAASDSGSANDGAAASDSGAAHDAAPADATPLDAAPACSHGGPYLVRLDRSAGGRVGFAPDYCPFGEVCERTVPAGATVTLVAEPDNTAVFVGWSNECPVSAATCTVTITCDTAVSATFTHCPGVADWSRHAGTPREDAAFAVAAMPDGGAVVVGRYFGAMDLGAGVTLLSSGGFDGFAARYAADGTPLWGRSIGGMARDELLAVAVAPTGNVVVAGRVQREVSVGGEVLVAHGHDDVAVAQLAGVDGVPMWTRRFGGIYRDGAFGVDTDAAGEVYVVGAFWYAMDVGAETLVATNGVVEDAFVMRLAGSDGTPTWARSFGGTGADDLRAVSVDGTALYVTGHYSPRGVGGLGDADFGGAVLSQDAAATDRPNVVIAKYATTDGTHLWSRGLGNSTDYFFEGGFAVEARDGAVTFGGVVSPGVDLGGGPTAGNPMAYVVRYDAAGDYLWHRKIGGTVRDERIGALAVDAAGRVYAAGRFIDSMEAGLYVHWGTPSSADGFVIRLDADGFVEWLQSFGGPGFDDVLGIALAAGEERVFAVGEHAGSVDFCAGERMDSSGLSDVFVAALRIEPSGASSGAPWPVLALPAPDDPTLCTPPPAPPLASLIGEDPVFLETSLGVLAASNGIALHDLDEDGDLDLLYSTGNSLGGEELRALRNEGPPLFIDATADAFDPDLVALDGIQNDGLHLFDANGDGRDDLFLVNAGQDYPTMWDGAVNGVLLAEATGGFVDRTYESWPLFENFTESALADDLDCDGDVDVTHNAWGFDNDGAAHFVRRDVLVEGMPALLCDFDRDGAPDLFSAADPADHVQYNDGHGRFLPAVEEDVPAHEPPHFQPATGACVDYDQDGWLDVVLLGAAEGGASTRLALYRNQGDHTFADRSGSDLPDAEDPLFRVVPADLNHDGWPDLVAFGQGCNGQPSTTETIFYLNRGGSFEAILDPLPRVASCARYLAGDVDGNGRDDLMRFGGGGEWALFLNATP